MPRNKNPEETVKKILEVSFGLFKEKGYEQTTVIDIVEKMGMSRGAFYHHFKTKEEVLYAIIEDRVDEEVQDKIRNNSDLTGLEKVRHLLLLEESPCGTIDKDSHKLMYMWLDLLKNPRVLSEHILESQGENAAWLVDLVRQGIDDGSIRKQDPFLLTEFVLLLVNIWTVPTIYDQVSLAMFEQKILMIKEILDERGCPLINGQVVDMFMRVANHYDVSEG